LDSTNDVYFADTLEIYGNGMNDFDGYTIMTMNTSNIVIQGLFLKISEGFPGLIQ